MAGDVTMVTWKRIAVSAARIVLDRETIGTRLPRIDRQREFVQLEKFGAFRWRCCWPRC